MVDHPMIPIVAVLLYGVLIGMGKMYFSSRSRWDWRITMSLWNLSLSVFSLIGFVRTAPKLYANLTNYSMLENFCFDPESHFGSGSSGLWIQLFILSKFPELVDTFFIVIHKKPLIFLHWYHHISVLLYCWVSYVAKAPNATIFCVMNYAVHSIMYFYYFLMAAKIKPKFFQAVYITVAQISQMVVGVIVTMYGCYLLWVKKVTMEQNCWLTPDNNFAALLMYGSYLFLFLQFFWQRYDTNAKKGSRSGTSNVTISNGHSNSATSSTTNGHGPIKKMKKEE
jgi:elongation of very long chain fatty acids protein 6